MNKRKISILLVFILVTSLLAACGTGGDSGQNDWNIDNIDITPVEGGRLGFAIQKPETFSPLFNNDRGTYYTLKLVYQSLVEFDQSGQPQPLLAESYEVMDNGTTWVFNLRQGVKWHDNTDFTSSDVIFTLDAIKNYKGSLELPYKDTVGSIVKSYRAIDENTVEIKLYQSAGVAPYYMDFPIISKENYKTIENITKEEFDNKMIGTGPYKLTEIQKLQFIKLDAFSDYWDGKAYINQINVKIVANYEAMSSSFKSGDTDLLLTSLNDWDWSKFTSRKDVESYKFNSSIYEFLGLNLSNTLFKEDAVRKAIMYGINRQDMVNKIYAGNATISNSPVHQQSFFYNDEMEKYEYNTAKAKEILEAAGWSQKNNRWVKEVNEEEQMLAFTIITNSDNELRKKTAEQIKSDLSKVGIVVEIQYVNWSEIPNKLAEKNYDAVLTGWNLSNIPDYSFAFHSNQVQRGSNFVGYTSNTMDTILEDIFRTTEEDKRKEHMEIFQNHFAEELPYISLFFKDSAVVAKKKVMGPIEPSQSNLFLNINKWYIPKALQ
jgi:peptide/nickel transport system substrate-binding protein